MGMAREKKGWKDCKERSRWRDLEWGRRGGKSRRSGDCRIGPLSRREGLLG